MSRKKFITRVEQDKPVVQAPLEKMNTSGVDTGPGRRGRSLGKASFRSGRYFLFLVRKRSSQSGSEEGLGSKPD